jgi:hypothetical protein
VAAIHRIRLQGAWRIERAEDGSAVFERSFGSPRTLDAGETVWLVCDRVPGNGKVLVNGEVIGEAIAGSAFEGEVTGVMRTRNSVRFELVGVADGESGEVGLEFRMHTQPRDGVERGV